MSNFQSDSSDSREDHAAWTVWFSEIIAIALGCYLLGRLGQLLAIEPGNVTPIFPAAGFGLAAIWYRGYRVAPGVFLGTFASDFWPLYGKVALPTAIAVGLAIGVGASLQACAGATGIRRYCRNGYPFDRMADLIWFVGLVIATTVVSSTIGTSVMWLGSLPQGGHGYGYIWSTWYFGDFVGIIMTVPCALTWRGFTNVMVRRHWIFEACALLLLTSIVCLTIFTGITSVGRAHLPIAYFVALPLIWAALRFEHFGIGVALLLITALATWGTVQGYGPFRHGDLNFSLILLQVFVAHTVIAIFLLSSALTERRSANEELKRSEVRFRSVFESGPLGIAVVTEDGTFIRISPAYTEMLGYSEDELVSKHFNDITHPDDVHLGRQAFGEMVAGRIDTFDLEKRYVRKDGNVVWSETVVSAVRNPDGRLRFAIAMSLDITARVAATHALKASEDRYRDLFENTKDMIQSVGPDGKLLFVNQAWRETLGYSDQDLESMNLFEIIHPEDRRLCSELFQRAVGGEKLDNVRARFLTKEGRTVAVEGSSSCRFEDGQPVATRGIFHDVTQRDADQQALTRYATALERSNEDLQQFASIASHDLQEPLRAIAGFSELLERRYKDRLDELGQEYIQFIMDGTRRMQTLLGDLLTYSRVSTAGKPFDKVDCRDAVDQALANLRSRIEESQADVQVGDLPKVPADATQLVQLFQNLIGNAIKYRGEQPPKVKIWADAINGRWQFAIQDNGIGIAPAWHDRIFVIFQRAIGRTDYPGTGIGLTICQRIVARHNGRIWVESEPGAGSTFYFTLGTEQDVP